MRAAVHQTAGFTKIALGQRGTDSLFVGLQEAGKQACGDFRIVGEVGILDELLTAVQRVVGSASELNEPTALEPLAIGRAEVPEIGLGIVEIERMSAGRSIKLGFRIR